MTPRCAALEEQRNPCEIGARWLGGRKAPAFGGWRNSNEGASRPPEMMPTSTAG